MYTYSSIQTAQLQKQVYINTQDMRVAVYLPELSPLAEISLDHSVHRNFQILRDSSRVIDADCDFIVVLQEDAEFMSTALMQYASAIREGADFCWADSVFGEKQSVHCFSAEQFDIRSANAVAMTKELFLRAAAVAGNCTGNREWIQCAAQLARKQKHIPLVLLSYGREVGECDIFVPGKKRALVLSHEFSMTGAPLVLTGVIPVMRDAGFEVTVLSAEPGNAMGLFQSNGALVITAPSKLNDSTLYKLVLTADLVWANTVVEAEAVSKLNGTSIPVIWWLHDAFILYSPWMEQRIIKQQMENIRIYAVGNRAKAAMHEIRPEFQIDQLIYGLRDLTKDPISERTFFKFDKSVRFVCIGSIEERKGQDILVNAIKKLGQQDLEKAQFVFVGKVFHENIYSQIQKLAEQYPENVSYIPFLNRDEIKAMMTQCDCLVCPSRDDPMPTVVTEAAMYGVPSIVSTSTGQAGLITDGMNGFVYSENDSEELCEKLQYAIYNLEGLKALRENCRVLYEEHFSESSFVNNVKDILECCKNTSDGTLERR